jgi:trk system potassium uptake protein
MTCHRISAAFEFVGDATQMAVLKEAKLKKADVLFATTHEDNVNLMVAQVARKIFMFPMCWPGFSIPGGRKSTRLGIDTIAPHPWPRDVPLGRCQGFSGQEGAQS